MALSVEKNFSVTPTVFCPVPVFATHISVILLATGNDLGTAASEIKGQLKTTVIGKETETINFNLKLSDNTSIPGGLVLAEVTKNTIYLPVTWSVVVFEDDLVGNQVPGVGDDEILKTSFDFETSTNWANGQSMTITGTNGGYKAAVKFKVTCLNG